MPGNPNYSDVFREKAELSRRGAVQAGIGFTDSASYTEPVLQQTIPVTSCRRLAMSHSGRQSHRVHRLGRLTTRRISGMAAMLCRLSDWSTLVRAYTTPPSEGS